MKDQLTLDMQQTKKADSGFNPLDAFVSQRWVESDVVLTPQNIAKWIIDYFKPTGFLLDPCKGDGAFYNNLPDPKDWCEIRKGKDFFKYSKKVDWIITNPPFTNVELFMEHSFNLAKNVVFILPAHKPFASWKRMKLIKEYGGIKELILIKGQDCNFPFRYPYGIFHFVKRYDDNIKIKVG